MSTKPTTAKAPELLYSIQCCGYDWIPIYAGGRVSTCPACRTTFRVGGWENLPAEITLPQFVRIEKRRTVELAITVDTRRFGSRITDETEATFASDRLFQTRN